MSRLSNTAKFREVYSAHLPNIHFGTLEEPTIIAFSAIPGSGKSELTKRLISSHEVSSIANKDIREAISCTGYSQDIISDYTSWLLSAITKYQPRTIVFDRNIDQWHKELLLWADHNQYRVLLVRIDVSRNILETRLRGRERKNADKVLGMLDFYEAAHKKVQSSLPISMVVKDNYDLDTTARIIASKI